MVGQGMTKVITGAGGRQLPESIKNPTFPSAVWQLTEM